MNLSYKISQKGGVSIYGLGRFPVTLYPEQMLALAKEMPKIEAFTKANAKALEEQAQTYAAAEAIADKRGLEGKAREEFLAQVMGKTQPKTNSARADLVDALEKKIAARGI